MINDGLIYSLFIQLQTDGSESYYGMHRTSTIILTVGSVVAMFWGCGGLTVIGTQPA